MLDHRVYRLGEIWEIGMNVLLDMFLRGEISRDKDV